MEEEVLKIAIAAFLHDIGKFAERGGLPVELSYLNNNAGLYQPYVEKQNRHTHLHAVYTAAFIEKMGKLFPERFNTGTWGTGDSFINLSAGHHKPETIMQWIVAAADRVASGFDRKTFDEYNHTADWSNYRKVRLIPLIEEIRFDNHPEKDSSDSYKCRYPLKALSPLSIFPVKREQAEPYDDEIASSEYRKLLDEFIDALGALEHKDRISLWFEHFENLYLSYTSHIPAATVGGVIPDVSLYDHSKITAALAAALYIYHREHETLEVKAIKEDYESKKFLLINGDFYGIQNFIFSQGGSTARNAAKLLRGRSFAVSLLTELAADYICRATGIPSVSIILNAAGKFTILAPNTENTRTSLKDAEETINSWFIRYFYGEVAMGISSQAASCGDFLTDSFGLLWDNLQKSVDEKKFRKINLEQYGGAVKDYLDTFMNTLKSPLCPFCGKRPSHPDVENDNILGGGSACKICRDHIYIGTQLVKSTRIAIIESSVTQSDVTLSEPLFGKYQISFYSDSSKRTYGKELLKCWDISISDDDAISCNVTAKYINGYVPVYRESDTRDNRILYGDASEKRTLEMIDMINAEKGHPKSFHHIAKMALTADDSKGGYKGVEALGMLKADVDRLGLVFACGIPEKRQSLSRFATLSRQMNSFFAIYLPYIIKNEDTFNDIYTVFSGGDDLFLIGPWNVTIDFASFLQKKFRDYVSENSALTISAGITINKPGSPLVHTAEQAEEALASSKSDGRNSITLFGHTVTWDNFKKLQEIQMKLEAWFKDSTINNAMLYRLNNLAEMVDKEQRVLEAKIPLEMDTIASYMLWRSMFKYAVIRNAGRGLKEKERQNAVEKVLEAASWLEDFHGAFQISLWQVLYNNR